MTHERGAYEFGSTTIHFEVERSPRRRTVAVAVEPNGQVWVKAPVVATADQIKAIVGRKAGWIVQRRADQREIDGALPYREFVGGESHWFQGRQYRLRISQQAGRTSASARLDGTFIAVDVPAGLSAEDRRDTVRRALIEWYRTAAVERLPERVAVYAAALGVPAPPVHVRDQEKRWGSCAPSGELRFNWRVMMGPLSLVDYVVAHEVCHLVHPDHSDAFWRLLGRAIPDYERRRERLRIMGPRFQI